ncbi:hypothetical protein [Lichenicoccus roseus]|uniref:Uncharacterized protein n=1 Tax=Lichenicoccus roseus TaxID=2683649 RepID=A0A5R9J912_9PROT|nr:hypothetical protein [Lichenicoccus roseus]TLU72071.1 hypothetical protein FE263_13175 [Lichenicoccus roseus]
MAAPDPKIVTLVGQLAQASDRSQAEAVAAQLESVREQSVQPAVRLLLRRAQHEMAAGKRQSAVSDLDDALALQPDSALLWRERAAAHDLDGDLDAAVQDLGGSISRDASDVLAWQALSAVEEQRGNATAAWRAWQHVLTLDPMIVDGGHRLDQLRRKALGQPA